MYFYNKTKLPKTTPVFDTYWKFAVARQDIFFSRIRHEDFPWTDDPILMKYKFTNVYRASDRVSQYLIRNVIYSEEWSLEDTIFRVLLFKTFNKISTWEYLEKRIGKISYSSFSVTRFSSVLMELFEMDKTIYSGAYIMASGKSFFHQHKKFENHLLLIEYMMNQNLTKKIERTKSMKEVYELLVSFPTIGSFLAYQYAIDLNYSAHLNFGENDFVKPGPGALSGIQKCFQTRHNLDETKIIRNMVQNQEKEFEKLGLNFKTLWGRRLHLIDCQNLFCEVDKYARIAHPEISSTQNRNRIKQMFKLPGANFEYWFPPKWNINEKIQTNV